MTGPENLAEGLELIILSGDDVRTFALPGDGVVTIGRGEGSAVLIDDPAVSRNHAILRLGPGLTIHDLGSANGTMLRPKRGPIPSTGETLNVLQLFNRDAPLSVGDTVVLGTTHVVVRHRPPTLVPDSSGPGPGVIVRDPAMRQLYEQVARIARATINVLILGETGVGKEVLAHAVHAQSRRAGGPFLGVNCAALTESLLESELFGFEKGAFTGANQARPGLFEAAEGGTVFLDEVGELSPAAQAKLLRVLEQRTVTRIGSTRARPIDVRIVTATNRDLEGESAAGRFRGDLFYRLNGVSLLIPPLRDRRDEIEPLARMFLAASAREIELQPAPALGEDTLRVLQAHRWPGNVRELRNAIDRAVVLCPGEVILPEHLPPALALAREAARAAVKPPTENGAMAVEERETEERSRILVALEKAVGNQTRAARLLGMSRGTLIARLNQLGLPRPRKGTRLP